MVDRLTPPSALDKQSYVEPVVFLRGNEVYASSRDVSAYFGKNHKDVLRAIEQAHCSSEFRERNFSREVYLEDNGATAREMPVVHMTKDGFAFIVMGFTGAKAGAFKERYIKAFNKLQAEQATKPSAESVVAMLNDPAALRGLLATYSDKVIALEERVGDLAPKADALARIAESDGSLCITDAAKTLQVRPKDLFRFLRTHGWIYSRGGGADVAYQDKIVIGYLEHKTTTVTRSDGSEKTVTQVRVTSKGLTRLAREFAEAA